ncbi:MAG TPA: TIGR03435 family protein [Acidobacteriaceae bacterium]
MRRTIFCAIGLLVALTSLRAQTILGTWQGTLPIPDNPRIAFKIETDAGGDGTFHGVVYEFDKGPAAVALTSVTFTAPDLTVDQVNLDISFKGHLSADGKSIAGTFTQQKQTYPLTLTLATPDTLFKRSGPAPLPHMSSTADPAFEVATIKPTPPDAKGSSYRWRTRDFTGTNHSVRDLIEFAYQVRDRQISGGPSWIADTKFDLAGEPDTPGLPSIDQYRLMIKKLLASRFNLQLHTVQKTFPVYALIRDENAPALHHSDSELDVGSCYTYSTDDGHADGQTVAQCVGFTMPLFADLLMRFIEDRQIVDETGLTGSFEFTLAMPSSAIQGGNGGPEDSRPDAFRQAIESLGFHLVPKKEAIPVLIIDHIDHPTPN